MDPSRETVLRDYRLAYRSRQASLLGRKEVFSGKAKFGIFGDGKEVAQLALAHAFRPGDFRSGYYRDQTFMMAVGLLTVEQFFAQLYAHPDVEADPASAGRQMNAHFASRTLDEAGRWKRLVDGVHSSADVSPTGSQMPRLVGLAYASKLYRHVEVLQGENGFSRNGNEIAFGTIGNASCAEGMFWEAVNAIGVLGAPAVISVWDDEYGISVHNEHQVTKGSISELLAGFQREAGSDSGYDLHRVVGWDYEALCETYERAAETARAEHVPQLIHVVELTQPQGHSTSGSHERYKDEQRLAWEQDHDCLSRMRRWIVEHELASTEELDRFEEEERREVVDLKSKAWDACAVPIRHERDELMALFDAVVAESGERDEVGRVHDALRRITHPARRDLVRTATDVIVATRGENGAAVRSLRAWTREIDRVNRHRYSSELHSETEQSALKVPVEPPTYAADAPAVRGFELLNATFDGIFAARSDVVAFGQDVGRLGDVNQGFAGLQEKYGELRISDAGIREVTIIGQAIGLAMRGLRPIVEIQYLDYVLYALQILSDDLATLRYRTAGGQKAPVIVRTRGHRLEGIWHSGSPMAGIINLVRGMRVCVPRDMTRAAGFYNTLLQSDEPALVVEVLNGYRLREKLPSNLERYRQPLGVPELLREGADVTLVTYGACCRIALDAADLLSRTGIEVEVIDVQTLLPFDRPGRIAESLARTGRVVFLDEDVPGGTTAFMMQQVLERHDGYHRLDSAPRTVTSRPHRPAYGSDGDYWSKPNREQVFQAVYDLMGESNPRRFPPIGD